MIVLGAILLILGFLTHIGILWTLGIVLVVVGAVLALVGMGGARSAAAAIGTESVRYS